MVASDVKCICCIELTEFSVEFDASGEKKSPHHLAHRALRDALKWDRLIAGLDDFSFPLNDFMILEHN